MSATVRVGNLPYGDIGSMTTLAHMRTLVNAAIMQPIVVEFAHHVVRFCAPRDYAGMARAIREWMAGAFRFVPDPIGVELTRTPDYMLRQYHTQGYVSGDCDDAATLGCAIAKAVGIPCKFVAIGFRTAGNFAHVYGVLYPRYCNMCVSLDVTKPAGVRAQVRRRTAVPV